MILRQDISGRFRVVGECYVHGLEDTTSILGPLPRQWTGIVRGDALGRQLYRYLNLWTFQDTPEDPRLDPLPSEWERVAYKRSPDDPAIFERFRNVVTGETINSDPRLSPMALEARGVNLKTFQLA